MDLYQAILARRSVRRYREEPLSREMLQQVDDIVDHAKPLISDNRFRVMRRDVITGEDLIAAMGGYGRILTPPHYMVAHIDDGQHALIDLGFRLEQVAINMVQLGISVCFIGSLGRESNVRVRFRLPSSARIGAFLLFGYPAESVTGRTINAVIRRTSGGTNRYSSDEIFYQDAFGAPTSPPKELAKLIEAGRRAPSANNTQPWRFLWQAPTLYLFLDRENTRYGKQPIMQKYCYFDGGTCMSNISMAMESLNLSGRWTLLLGANEFVPNHPDALIPLAKLELT
ncbi:MAG: nitroreductase family protein [Anaerolineae bacterium]